MRKPPMPPDEAQRLAALDRYQVLDTLPEEAFDELAELAATLCDTPIALITFVDEDRQWYKACIGLDHDETDREVSFCAHALVQPGETLVVSDALDDERFHDNPIVAGDPGVRFYAGAPIVTPDGHALGTVCVLDTEPRQLAEDQIAGLETLADQVVLRLEERVDRVRSPREASFLQGVIDAIPDHVAILDEEGRILATNEAWDAFARSHDAEAGPGSDYLAAAHAADGEDARRTERGLRELLAGERSILEMEYPCHGPDEERWFRMTASTFEAEGRPRLVVAHRNVTEERRLSDEREEVVADLAESHATLQTLAGVLPQVLWIVGADLDEIVFQSEDAPGFWGLPGERLLESPLSFLELVDERDREAVDRWISEGLEAIRQDPDLSVETEFRFQHGETDETRWVRIQAVPVHVDGDLVQIAGILEDVTEARQERARESQRAREKARVEELQQLAFATSHTLKTEVRRIRSFGQLLRNRAAQGQVDQLDEPVEEMLQGSVRLEALHEGLRKYAEVTQGHAPFQQVDLASLLQEVLAERSDEIEGVGGRGTLGEVPPVRGDPEQLRQLLSELVDNAVKFAGPPPVDLEVTAERSGDQVEVSIADRGIGFEPDYAERIFGIFQQLDPHATEGVGVGLTICRRIVENHGGTIRADAEPGEGATFTFTLPAASD